MRRACPSRTFAPLGFAALLLATKGFAAQGPEWRVEGGEVKVVCPLTVGGSFEARTVSLAGTLSLSTTHPPAFAGELLVDVRTLDTGIDLRSDHMRSEYLEVGRGAGFDTAVLSEIGLGDVDAGTFQGHTTFTGTLQLHGAKKAIRGGATIHHDEGSVRVEATFPLKLADFGIPSPQYLGVGVKGEVQVRVLLTGTPLAPAESPR